MDQDQLGQLVIRAFNAAVERDIDRIADALDAIGNTGDPFDMYAACCGFAEIGKGALKKIYGDRVPRPEQGDMWVIEELKPGALSNNPPKAFAARFLIAYCNDDRDTSPALFRAALEAGPEQFVDSVSALLADVAGIARLALDQTA